MQLLVFMIMHKLRIMSMCWLLEMMCQSQKRLIQGNLEL